MKIFQQTQKNIAYMGQIANSSPLNTRSLLVICIFGLAMFSNGVYIFHQAKTFQDYVDSISIALALFVITAYFLYTLFNKRVHDDCIREFEEIIDGSKLAYGSIK